MNVRKELPLLILVALPFLYLGYIYGDLPQTVPTHWNAQGEIDDWGDKGILWIIPLLTVAMVYILMSIVPKIDPKGQIKQMGNKFYQLKFVLILFMAALAMYIIYATQQQTMSNPKFIYILIGILFAALGNYLPSVKPNYFVGIRTPWTLENESVWKKTHRLAGKVWVAGGILLLTSSFLISQKVFFPLFITITILLVFIPLIYSYLTFKKETVNE